jgi:5-methylcytosine-specific restriction enzyme subunit McrC
MKTEQKYWSRLQKTKAHIEQFSYSQDNLPNQCIKLATIKALKLSKSAIQLKDCVPIFAETLRQFTRVSQRSANELLLSIPLAQDMVPSIRDDYALALSLAIEILNHSDFSLDTNRDGIHLESYIISLDDAFEGYIRNVLKDSEPPSGVSFAILDGNLKRHQKMLFLDNRKYSIKPDIIMKVDKNITMIGDVKYKIKPKEVDRYQIISHSLSFGVSRAVLVYPRRGPSSEHGLTRLGKVGIGSSNVVVFEYHYDLAGDLLAEEAKFRNEVLPLALA